MFLHCDQQFVRKNSVYRVYVHTPRIHVQKSTVYSQNWMKRFLAPVALTLFDSDRLRRTVVFHAVKVQVKAGDLLETLGSFDELGVAQ